MNLFPLLFGIVFAGAEEDLSLAANTAQAEKIRMDAFNRLVELGKTDLSHVLRVSQNSQLEMRVRWVAIRVLGQVGGDEALGVIPPLLKDKDASIRSAALSALGDMRAREYAKTIARLLRDDAIIVRAAAADALGVLGNPDVIPQLGAALSDESNWYHKKSLWVRRHYVVALGKIADKKAYPVLLRSLTDEDSRVVSASLVSLEKIAGFSMTDGRDRTEEIEAWRRWLSRQLSK